MQPIHYETIQSILDQAGMSQIVRGEILGGTIDGTNVTFTTAYKPLSDSNDDDVVDPTDVTAYVNGTTVNVRTIDPINGIITLVTAPAVSSIVTCDYRYSSVSWNFATKIREEAEQWINDEMKVVDTIPYNPVPPTVRKLTRMYAAAQLLIKDYGFSHDTAGTSKDGTAIMALLEGSGEPNKGGYKPGLLARYIAIGGASGLSDVAAAETTVVSDGQLFFRGEDIPYLPYTEDMRFMDDLGVDDGDLDVIDPDLIDQDNQIPW